jgi:hypothetical protein
MLGCVTYYFMRTRTAYSRPDMHVHAQRAQRGSSALREEGGGPDPAAARLATHPILTAPR